MTVCFVTGTDTEVGKTVVTAALAAIFGSCGHRVAVVKPAQTGVAAGEPGDVDEIRRLAGPLHVVEGARLPDPLAPDRAAALARLTLPSLGEQRDLVIDAAATHDTVLVEGAGGVLVRLGASFTLLDIADQVRAAGEHIKWYVVTRPGLGTLNHSTLTVHAIQQRGFVVCGLVIGAWPNNPGPAEQYNRVDLSHYTGVPLLGALPEGAAALRPEVFQAQARSWLPDLGPA